MTGTEPIFLLAGAIAAWLYKVVTDKRVQALEDERDASAAAWRVTQRQEWEEHQAELGELRARIEALAAELHAARTEAASLGSSGVSPAAPPDTEIDP